MTTVAIVLLSPSHDTDDRGGDCNSHLLQSNNKSHLKIMSHKCISINDIGVGKWVQVSAAW